MGTRRFIQNKKSIYFTLISMAQICAVQFFPLYLKYLNCSAIETGIIRASQTWFSMLILHVWILLLKQLHSQCWRRSILFVFLIISILFCIFFTFISSSNRTQDITHCQRNELFSFNGKTINSLCAKNMNYTVPNSVSFSKFNIDNASSTNVTDNKDHDNGMNDSASQSSLDLGFVVNNSTSSMLSSSTQRNKQYFLSVVSNNSDNFNSSSQMNRPVLVNYNNSITNNKTGKSKKISPPFNPNFKNILSPGTIMKGSSDSTPFPQKESITENDTPIEENLAKLSEKSYINSLNYTNAKKLRDLISKLGKFDFSFTDKNEIFISKANKDNDFSINNQKVQKIASMKENSSVQNFFNKADLPNESNDKNVNFISTLAPMLESTTVGDSMKSAFSFLNRTLFKQRLQNNNEQILNNPNLQLANDRPISSEETEKTVTEQWDYDHPWNAEAYNEQNSFEASTTSAYNNPKDRAHHHSHNRIHFRFPSLNHHSNIEHTFRQHFANSFPGDSREDFKNDNINGVQQSDKLKKHTDLYNTLSAQDVREHQDESSDTMQEGQNVMTFINQNQNKMKIDRKIINAPFTEDKEVSSWGYLRQHKRSIHSKRHNKVRSHHIGNWWNQRKHKRSTDSKKHHKIRRLHRHKSGRGILHGKRETAKGVNQWFSHSVFSGKIREETEKDKVTAKNINIRKLLSLAPSTFQNNGNSSEPEVKKVHRLLLNKDTFSVIFWHLFLKVNIENIFSRTYVAIFLIAMFTEIFLKAVTTTSKQILHPDETKGASEYKVAISARREDCQQVCTLMSWGLFGCPLLAILVLWTDCFYQPRVFLMFVAGFLIIALLMAACFLQLPDTEWKLKTYGEEMRNHVNLLKRFGYYISSFVAGFAIASNTEFILWYIDTLNGFSYNYQLIYCFYVAIGAIHQAVIKTWLIRKELSVPEQAQSYTKPDGITNGDGHWSTGFVLLGLHFLIASLVQSTWSVLFLGVLQGCSAALLISTKPSGWWVAGYGFGSLISGFVVDISGADRLFWFMAGGMFVWSAMITLGGGLLKCIGSNDGGRASYSHLLLPDGDSDNEDIKMDEDAEEDEEEECADDDWLEKALQKDEQNEAQRRRIMSCPT